MRIRDWSSDVCSSDLPKGLQPEGHNRFERILNQLSGKIWLDDDYNVLKAEARLTSPVRFAWGLLAGVDGADIPYARKQHGNVWRSDERRVGEEWDRTCRIRVWPYH